MTPKAEEFLARMAVVKRMIQGGAPVFPALAAGLDDDDWLLVYAAVAKMILDIEGQHALSSADRE
jgi:hypothetical protein